jgi:hypothetical protein
MSERFGIVIGISDYSHVSGAANLRFASADANRLAQILVTNGRIPPNHIYMLSDNVGKDQQTSYALQYPRSM